MNLHESQTQALQELRDAVFNYCEMFEDEEQQDRDYREFAEMVQAAIFDVQVRVKAWNNQ